MPRTGTSSLRAALQALLGGPCLHMSAIPSHPFDLGPGWRAALVGQPADWPMLLGGYVAAVDWPALQFWRVLKRGHRWINTLVAPICWRALSDHIGE